MRNGGRAVKSRNRLLSSIRSLPPLSTTAEACETEEKHQRWPSNCQVRSSHLSTVPPTRSPPPKAATPTDYLTRLPQETLQYICELSVDPLHPIYLGLVAKAFLPFARRRTFRRTVVHGSPRLIKLVETIEASPSAGVYIKKLTLTFDPTRIDAGNPSSKAIIILLTRLAKLKQLIIQGSGRIAQAVVSDTRTPRLFPSLQVLTIEYEMTDWKQPFDPAHFRNLGRHAKLNCLDLLIDRSSQSFGRYRSPKELKKIETKMRFGLTLRGALLGNPAAEDFIESFPAVGQLFLHEREKEHVDTLPSFLSKIASPKRLWALSLDLPQAPTAFDKLKRVLSTFTALQVLQLDANAFHSSLLPTIRSLPRLEELHLLEGCDVSGADIKSLLKPSVKLSHLRLLVLSHLRTETVGGVASPQWTERFTKGDMEEILELAGEKMVEVVGFASEWMRRSR